MPNFDPTPLSLTSMIIEVLKNYFVNNEEYPYVLGDPSRSTISILESAQFKPDEIQKRPAIITKREAIQIGRQCIGDVSSANEDSVSFIVNFSGTFTVTCLATLPQEAEVMAREALQCLLIFQNIISRDFNFLRFQVVNIGGTFQKDEWKEAFGIPISIVYEISKKWTLKPDALPIKKVKTAIDSNIC